MDNVERWVQRTKAGIKDQKKTAERNWDEANPEIEDASDRCGMDSLHSLTGMVLVETATGDEWGVQYAWISAPIRFIATRGILFQFASEEGVYNVEISGDGTPESIEGLRRIARKLSWAKRALTWANGSTVKAIRIERVEEEEGD